MLQCDRLCGEGQRRRKVTCYRKTAGRIEVLDDGECSADDRPASTQPCTRRPCAGVDWIASDWSGCAGRCGLSVETRSVHCASAKGQLYDDAACQAARRPAAVRPCDAAEPCAYRWYTSQWSQVGPPVFLRSLMDRLLYLKSDTRLDPIFAASHWLQSRPLANEEPEQRNMVPRFVKRRRRIPLFH